MVRQERAPFQRTRLKVAQQLQPERLTGRLAALEAVIESGIETFVEVGNALLEIRDNPLYREQGYSSFEAYCRARWHWSKTHANRQIDAARVVQNLTPIGVKPQNEAQARELAPLPPGQQREVAVRLDLTTATAKDVHAEVARVRGTMRPACEAHDVGLRRRRGRPARPDFLDTKTKLIHKIHTAMRVYPQKHAELSVAILGAVRLYGPTEKERINDLGGEP